MKKWPLILLFSMAFNFLILLIGIAITLPLFQSLRWFATFAIIAAWLFVLHVVSTIATLIFIEYRYAAFSCAFSFIGACGNIALLAAGLLKFVSESENYYILTPFIILIMGVIEIVATLEIWGIIRLIQKGKKLVFKKSSGYPTLSTRLISEVM